MQYRAIKSGAITILTIAIVVAMVGCKGRKKAQSMPPISVECTAATEQKMADKISFATQTEALRSVTIEPRVNGYMEQIRYSAGEPVKRGAVVFRIDPSQLQTEYLAAEASLESAQASLIEAKNNYERAIPLVQIDAISRSQYDTYLATYRAAEANVKYATQSLENARLNTSYTIIRAPFDGLIGKSPANLGDYVGPGTSFATLTTIEQIDTLMVDLAIPTSQYLSYAKVGRGGSDNNQIEYGDVGSYDNSNLLSDITVVLADSTTYNQKGSYYYTKQSVSDGSSTVVIVATLPNPQQELKSNMFTRVVANIGTPTEHIVVPQVAVSQMQGVNSVWVIKPDSTAEYRKVELGSTYGDMWHVKSGLKAGEQVATSSQLKIHQGAKVAPKPYNKMKTSNL